MPEPGGIKWAFAPEDRDRLAFLLAIVTIVFLIAAFLLSKDTQFLMPGPLASAHGTIEKCSACHTKSGSGKLGWIHGLLAGDPLADSKACLTCHKMPSTAFNAHGASTEVLKQSTERLVKIAAATPVPKSARAQSVAFPTHDLVARGLYCATCHQEHQGANFTLNKISDEQCRSCHVVKFDSFDGHHPKFENYPFKRRSRIIYDHAAHFDKHFPEVAKKDAVRRIPETCSSCHNTQKDKRVMAVAPFDQTCATCHLDQIVGKERASGPKGIPFLSLPGLDLQTLKRKNAAIGEWPDASEAALTPFMKIMISRNEQGRALLNTVNSVNLQDLTHASDDQIKAVASLVWEIKALFYALITGKASDVLSDLNVGSEAKPTAALVADLTASIPRDVIVRAHQQWLPNLNTEMASRAKTGIQKRSGLDSLLTQSSLVLTATAEDLSRSNMRQPNPWLKPRALANVGEPEGKLTLAADDSGEATATERLPLPNGTPRSIKAAKDAEKAEEGAAEKAHSPNAGSDGRTPSTSEQIRARPAVNGAAKAAKPTEESGNADAVETRAVDGNETLAPKEGSQDKAPDQSDDLLLPTEDELHAIKAGIKETGKARSPEDAAGKTAADKADAGAPARATGIPAESESAAAAARDAAAPAASIDSEIDPESWAEYGGWYRQDYTISYRPTGHKDKFIYSWLFLTGPHAARGDRSPAAAVFNYLTSKEAPGSCTKCHSLDDIQGRGRLVNFAPASAESKQGRFTHFIHEPHFGIMENRGCLTCHELEKGRPYLKSYEHGNPQSFASNFAAVKKDLCQTCHAASMARQDCLTCHKYHVNDVLTPIITTRNPSQ